MPRSLAGFRPCQTLSTDLRGRAHEKQTYVRASETKSESTIDFFVMFSILQKGQSDGTKCKYHDSEICSRIERRGDGKAEKGLVKEGLTANGETKKKEEGQKKKRTRERRGKKNNEQVLQQTVVKDHDIVGVQNGVQPMRHNLWSIY